MLSVLASQAVTSQPAEPAFGAGLLQMLRDIAAYIQTATLPNFENLPNKQEFMEILAGKNISLGFALLFIGVIYLILGGKFYKYFVCLNSAVIGSIAGGVAAICLNQEAYWWQAMAGGAVMFGLLAWPLIKLMVGLLCSAVGGAMGITIFDAVVRNMGNAEMLQYSWAGGIAGALLMGVIGFLLLPVGVRMLHALLGTAAAAVGVLIVCLKDDYLTRAINKNFNEQPMLVFIALGGLFLIGFSLQLLTIKGQLKAEAEKKAAKQEQANQPAAEEGE